MTKLVNKDKERLNPCIKEQDQSYECLNKNNYDQSKCDVYFDNYNTCKKFWGKVFSDRRAQGLHPFLPEVEDREKIKQDYMNKIRQGL